MQAGTTTRTSRAAAVAVVAAATVIAARATPAAADECAVAFADPPTAWDGGCAVPDDIEIADLNGDGVADLLVSCASPEEGGGAPTSWRVLLGDGAGGFATAFELTFPSTAAGSQALLLDVGDVDDDGDLDVVAGSAFGFPGPDRLQVFLNDGTGTVFEPGWSVSGAGFLGVDVGDVNGDDRPDVSVAVWLDASRVYVNDGTGDFVLGDVDPASIVFRQRLGDVDGDGDLDVVRADVTTGVVEALVNDGAGSFTPTTVGMLDDAGDLLVADVDGDGLPDVVCAQQGEAGMPVSLATWLATGPASFAAPVLVPIGEGRTRDLEAADVDGDGDVDLVLGVELGLPRLLCNDGTGMWTVSDLAGGVEVAGSFALALGDLDGDAAPDVAAGDMASSDAVWINACDIDEGVVGDLDGNGAVNFFDLLELLADWGPCAADCPADLNDDGLVGFADLVRILVLIEV